MSFSENMTVFAAAFSGKPWNVGKTFFIS